MKTAYLVHWYTRTGGNVTARTTVHMEVSPDEFPARGAFTEGRVCDSQVLLSRSAETFEDAAAQVRHAIERTPHLAAMCEPYALDAVPPSPDAPAKAAPVVPARKRASRAKVVRS